MENFDQIMYRMKNFGNFLMPYNFPQVPATEEEDINFIKLEEVCVDGYNLVLHYNKNNYGTYYAENLQIMGKYSPFIPFSLVCKIGKKFLGERFLSLVELFKFDRKIYCWTLVTDKEGEAIEGSNINGGQHCVYDGLEYSFLDHKQVNFY